MEYIIINAYTNQHNKMLELRNVEKKSMMMKTPINSEYEIGEFVIVEEVNKRPTIIKKINQPHNHLDFYHVGVYTEYQLRQQLEGYIETINNPKFRMIIEELVLKQDDYFLYPAGKSMHHAYLGGLCEHTLSILNIAKGFIKQYDLDQDLLFTGIILHDYGKLRELKQYGVTYTIEGNILGHIIICAEEIANIAINLGINQDADIMALKHLILSHHGRLDYGSPKEPMIKEAYVLSMLDELDAKMNLLNNVLEDVRTNEISPAINGFDRRRFWNYKGE